MQHGPQRKRLAFDHPVVIFSKELPVRLYVLKEHVAVQDQRVCLVPCLVHPRPPILGTILILSEITIVSPHGIVCTDRIGATHYLDHLDRKRRSVKHIPVQLYVYAVQKLHVSLFRHQKLILSDLVVWLNIQPLTASSGSEKTCEHDHVCKNSLHSLLIFRMLCLPPSLRCGRTDSLYLFQP